MGLEKVRHDRCLPCCSLHRSFRSPISAQCDRGPSTALGSGTDLDIRHLSGEKNATAECISRMRDDTECPNLPAKARHRDIGLEPARPIAALYVPIVEEYQEYEYLPEEDRGEDGLLYPFNTAPYMCQKLCENSCEPYSKVWRPHRCRSDECGSLSVANHAPRRAKKPTKQDGRARTSIKLDTLIPPLGTA
eukprot:Blabericola_migrator_1__7736@NODE_3952_length_1412_cov_3_039405_g2442_i0_p1_GENE_NODE_3952_length_1412_cov_3_039405_g2442_i0NODE_3952_length_1412_cov_3_039405_g2442_i0_p1_ORF_typecomplete_len191_score11_18_NODE_3952_length_1412_cov_3_039405_g2442_i0253825